MSYSQFLDYTGKTLPSERGFSHSSYRCCLYKWGMVPSAVREVVQ